MPGLVDTAVHMLDAGRPGTEVIAFLRAHCTSGASLACALTPVRKRATRPEDLAALRMSNDELLAHTRDREAALLKKNETLVIVPHAVGLLEYAVGLLQTARVGMPIPRLALPLLLVSGRRSVEMLNGKSTFLPTPRPTTCVFTGQVKKRGAGAPYEIPLLCNYAIFTHGLGVLRATQGYAQLEPIACSRKYARMLGRALPDLIPPVANPHALRGVYAAYAYHLYAADVTFNRAAMRMLGHEVLGQSLAYNNIVLREIQCAGAYGPLP